MKQFRISSSVLALLAGAALPQSVVAQSNPQDTVSSGDPKISSEKIVVTGIRAALASSAAKKREAGNIRDVVTAEDIGKFPDENVADSLARIPGVQITREIGEGANFTIRGISQNRVEVNGRTTIGREEERNASIGDIPADLLGGLEVIKSPTADMTEGSLGGTVNLLTRRAFDFNRPTINLNLRTGYTTNSEKFQPNVNVLGTTRWDTGIGEFGILLNGAVSLIATCLRSAELSPFRVSSGHEQLPLGQCGRAAGLVGLSVDEVAF